ncbi:Pc03g00250 [Penicillium rubens Wisconsin 54-1255]|uniref:Pc03g00250 protein n=1 Tax=Penicillium rubens (strain ATCC 28089 / DSM 1075 / NRRL 1951 / Wisconsin 54-1255) TaxID=500485 RepID=B6GVS1_PENRW|nr:Pc03g00250 [Penicillium rubens Wisconsin 54-1255]
MSNRVRETPQERVFAHTCFYQEQHPNRVQKLLKTVTSGCPRMTSPLATTFDCPNTRKNKRDYAALNKYGLLAEDIPLQPPRNKMAVRSAVKSPTPPISTSPTAPSNVSMSLSNLDRDIRPSQSISQVECEVERIEIKQKDETRSKERSWVWKHYLTTPESALKQHLQQTHKLFQDGHSGCQGPLSSWISKEKKLPFEEAALNLIVSTCQPFTCVEQPSFKAMLRSAGFQVSVPSADTVSRRLCLRLDALDTDNASNNDTLHRYLYQKLSQRYDGYLAETIIREGTMKFTHNSQVRCFAHILNLVMKTTLRSLHASSHKEACDLLDDVAKRSWKTVNAPTSPIAKLRLLVLWIARSPQRIQKWDNRPGCTKAINYDVDTRWNSTFVMIERRGEWAKVSPAIAVPISDGISLLEKYHDCVKENDIYYIASVLDPRIKTKWLKTLPDGEKIIDRIRAFLKKAYPTPKQPASIAPSSTNYKSFEYRFLEAFQPTQYNVAEPDIDQYFGTPTISTGFDISQSQTEFIRSWWKANRLEFSCTAKVAQDRLAIPAAEVDVERLFNDGRDVLGIRRFSMKGKTLGALIRLKEGNDFFGHTCV